MRSRNRSGAFCQKIVFPAHEILESPEDFARHIHFSRKETVILQWKAITNVSDAPYFTNVNGVLSDIVELR
jgi:hypothetical protein